MYVVIIAWGYVVLLMAVAEATSTQGTVLGAFFTFVLYGLLPLSIVMYLLGTPGRWRARKQAEAAEAAAAAASAATAESAAADGDGGGPAPGAGLAPERKEP